MPGRPLILALLPLVLWSGLLGGERTGPVSPGPGGQPAPGYVAWFKADAIMGLNDGDPVSAWDDSGPSNQDAAFEHLQIRADKVYHLNDTGYAGTGTAPSQAAIGGRQNGVYPFKGISPRSSSTPVA